MLYRHTSSALLVDEGGRVDVASNMKVVNSDSSQVTNAALFSHHHDLRDINILSSQRTAIHFMHNSHRIR